MKERNRLTKAQLNALRDEAYSHARECGFHDEPHSEDHYLCLVASEVMEAVEADRKGRRCTHDLNYIYDVEDNAAFNTIFKTKVKDTVEDELADTAIRLLDYAGLCSLEIDQLGTPLKIDGTFTEQAWLMVGTIYAFNVLPKDTAICVAIGQLFQWAERLDFDLAKHIELKMRYNRNRPHLHGKKY